MTERSFHLLGAPQAGVAPSGVRLWLALAAAAVALLSGCATTKVTPLGETEDARPSEVDERYIWKLSVDTQRDLDRSGLLFRESELQAYVNGVARDLVGSRLSQAGMKPRVRILSDVDVNAFALPNGAVYLHTAILSRMDNEAQLATVLGHEFSHTIQRHALRQHRDVKNKTAIMSTAAVVLSAGGSVGGAGISVDVGGFANLLLQLSTASSIYGFSRSLESEADRLGLQYMAQAGYDVNEAPKLFETMIAYQDELEEQGIEHDSEPFFFSSHQKMKHRIKSYRELLSGRYRQTAADRSRVRNEEIFAERVEGVIVHQAQLELDAGRYRSAEITVQRALRRNPGNAHAWAVLGEALQSPKGGKRSAEALAAYRRALECDPDHPRAHRALGMTFYKRWSGGSRRAEDAADALLHFERFVELSPRAPDRGYVDAYVRELHSAQFGPSPEVQTP